MVERRKGFVSLEWPEEALCPCFKLRPLTREFEAGRSHIL